LNEVSDLRSLLEFFVEKSHKKDSDELNKVRDTLGSWIEKAELDTQSIRDNLYKEWACLAIKCNDKYPMIRHLDDTHFNSWRQHDPAWIHDCINYANVIDSTWDLTTK